MSHTTTLDNQYDSLIRLLLMNKNYSASSNKLVSLNSEFYFKFDYGNYKHYETDFEVAADQLYLKGVSNKYLPVILENERRKIYEIEKYEREMILNDLIFATHINISKFNEPLTSRRFIATNDSCLTFAQVTLDYNKFRWVFVSRSTECHRMLPADFKTIAYIINEWTNWFMSYIEDRSLLSDHFGKMGYSLFFILNNPHVYIK